MIFNDAFVCFARVVCTVGTFVTFNAPRYATEPMRLFNVNVLNFVSRLLCCYRLFASFSLFLVNGVRLSSCSRTFCSSSVDVQLQGLLRKNHDDTAQSTKETVNGAAKCLNNLCLLVVFKKFK